MAINQRASDISGKIGKEEDFCVVVVRRGAGLDEPKQFDALKSEVAHLTESADVVELEIKDGAETRSVIPRADFDALAKDINKVLAAARGLRGRQKGTRFFDALPTQRGRAWVGAQGAATL